jgi:alcohol dehydrogenase class IV
MDIDPSTLRANWSYPTQIRFGVGRISELLDCCKELGLRRPLFVTDPSLAKLPAFLAAKAALDSSGLESGLFCEIRANPVGKNVEAGVRVFREGRHDGVIAFGGGSALDSGKAIAFMTGQTRPIWDFEDVGDFWKRASTHALPPVIAIPTTAGTGSEVGRASVITDESVRVKKIIFHPRMLPTLVICDPQLTLGLPPQITAATGMDALAHNLEAYCAPGFHPLADGIALEALRLLHDWLPVSVREGSNLVARAYQMAAASMGAVAFQKGLGAIHALSHPIGAVLDSHHGLTNGVVMPYVLAFNRSAIEDKMERLGRYLGLRGHGVDGVLDWVLALREAIGIPHSVAQLGMTRAHLAQFSKMAAADPCAAGNPIKIGEPELRTMYEAALDGWVEGRSSGPPPHHP